MSTQNDDITPSPDGEPLCEDHEWKLQDESFGHEFGTEVVVFYECENCGATKPVGDHDFEDDYGPDD